ncbi:MAG: hypothetical protein A2Y24_01060 [Clostridiales bacterium GWE2_32_10]|nr:MAG: hypothetical protein A2Y24_01060 [Clostridiales bacterium GWE2_32_10]HBY21203.1 KH domain-containing protein [Clostridiales bacterium]
MKNVLELIVKSLVDHPEQILITEISGEKGAILELKVAEEDMGKVIGKQGKVAKSIRTVIKAIAAREGKRVIVEIIN